MHRRNTAFISIYRGGPTRSEWPPGGPTGLTNLNVHLEFTLLTLRLAD